MCYFVRTSFGGTLRRYSSGQRGQTVNLLTYVYEGSNPSRRTKCQNQSDSFGFVVFSSDERDSKARSSCEFRSEAEKERAEAGSRKISERSLFVTESLPAHF